MPKKHTPRDEPGRFAYDGLDRVRHTAEFMTVTCACTPSMRASSPAVVHLDGTARPQSEDTGVPRGREDDDQGLMGGLRRMFRRGDS